MNPALRYFGGKWSMADWIISHFPPHERYIEPCGGGASVLINKTPVNLEIYNDIDGNVVNFFRVLRDRPEELAQAVYLTPYAKEEFKACKSLAGADDLERARRFFTVLWQGRSGVFNNTGWRRETKVLDYTTFNSVFTSQYENLLKIAARLRAVQIDNIPAEQCIADYDHPTALIYFDPPYVLSTRTDHRYTHDVDDSFHIKTAGLLLQCKSDVVVSGYPSPLYTELYEANGWHTVDKENVQTVGNIKAVERLWIKPETWAKLGIAKQKGLF